MSIIKLRPDEVGAELRARASKTPAAITKAMFRAAKRGQAMLARRTPKDLGQAKAGWKTSEPVRGSRKAHIDLYNDVPHIGILEHGARPHPVSLEGRIAIHEWVVRHYNSMRKVSGPVQPGKKKKTRKSGPQGREQEMLDITNAIIHKIRTKGQDPTYFVKRSMPELQEDFGKQLNKQISDFSKRKARRGGKK